MITLLFQRRMSRNKRISIVTRSNYLNRIQRTASVNNANKPGLNTAEEVSAAQPTEPSHPESAEEPNEPNEPNEPDSGGFTPQPPPEPEALENTV